MKNEIGLNELTPGEHFVRYAINIGAIEFVPDGRKLKSGRISPYFFNSGLFNTGTTIGKLGKMYAAEIYSCCFIGKEPIIKTGVIFGPAYKAIPLSVVTAVEFARLTGRNIGYAFNRKEEKTHGDGGSIVGASLAGKKVLVVDDVMTTGTSSGEAVEIIRANGGTPIGCVIAFDRQERGKESDLSAVQEFEQNFRIPVYAIATLADLIRYLQKVSAESGDDANDEMLDKILAYQKEYGVAFL